MLCDEVIGALDAWAPLNAAQYAHRECELRAVLGGIGHHLGHGYWCLIKRDTDAGLTYRQSAKMVVALIDVMGIEWVSHSAIVEAVDIEDEEEARRRE